jgi:hypothetical protein
MNPHQYNVERPETSLAGQLPKNLTLRNVLRKDTIQESDDGNKSTHPAAEKALAKDCGYPKKITHRKIYKRRRWYYTN